MPRTLRGFIYLRDNMANPQTKNGYVRIANDIYESLCRFRIPGEVRQVIDCVIRKTYGYNKKSDWLSNSQIVEMTGLKKGNVSRALSKAITNKIVIKKDNKLSINKDYEEWISFNKVIKSDNKKKLSKKQPELSKVKPKLSKTITTVIQSEGHKRHNNITKDNITKDIGETPSQKMKRFIISVNEETQEYSDLLEALSLKGVPEELARQELKKFVSYWTELNKSGTKQKWELQKTFEVQRRLATWFGNIRGFNKQSTMAGKNYDN